MKQPEEKLDFIAKVCYPFWLIPWGDSSLLFDGLNTTAHTLAYKVISDVKAFLENAKRSVETRETYLAFLSDNLNYFQTAGAQKEMVIDGLITDSNFLEEFTTYLSEATKVKGQLAETIVLSPTIDELSISSMKQELENLKSKFEEEIRLLYESMKFLNKITGNFINEIRNEIKTVEEEFKKEIEKHEELITPKIDKIRKEYDKRITKLSKDFEKKLLSLHQEKIKIEKSKEQTLRKIEHFQAEAKSCAINQNAIGERKWKEAIRESKRELSELEARIRELDEMIRETEEEKTLEIFELRSECEVKITEVKKDLLEIEASRDAKIRFYKQEMEKLEELTSTIIEQINETAKLREETLVELKKLGIKQRRRKCALIYMPFFLACYQSESRKRYVHFPPSIVNSIGFSVKLKSALGRIKIKRFLLPRFRTITSLLNKFPLLIERNAVFEREINEAGSKANILKTRFMRELIRNGLEQLREEGWLSEKEYESFDQKLA